MRDAILIMQRHKKMHRWMCHRIYETEKKPKKAQTMNNKFTFKLNAVQELNWLADDKKRQ